MTDALNYFSFYLRRGEKMKLNYLLVEGLFDMFNYEIPIKENVNIIYGLNGYGKTSILKLLNAAFQGDEGMLVSIPFRSLELYFDDEANLLIYKSEKEFVDYKMTNADGKVESHKIFATASIANLLKDSNLIFISGDIVQDPETNEYYDLGDSEVIRGMLAKRKTPPDFLVGLREANTVSLIESQRLYKAQDTETPGHKSPLKPMVNSYAEELANNISKKLAEYAAVSQKLDGSFPSRLIDDMVDRKNNNDISMDYINSELGILEHRRRSLKAAGLLDVEVQPKLSRSGIDQATKKVLALYIEDTKEKLAIFDDLEKKIQLLLEIINNKFHHKKMLIKQEEGFIFFHDNGYCIKPDKLSSGEQHLLVLVYSLLFKPNSLVLIDEPEISLHIAWQDEFLNDLTKIAELVKCKFLIATHSPQLVGDFWDYAIELKGD